MSKAKSKNAPAIGYGKPPEGKRFAKGQSGNPAGRPRKSLSEPIPSSIRDLILEVVGRKLTIREGEETRRISTKEAVIRAQIATALKGNPLAQREITHLTMRCEAEAKQEFWENYHFWADYKEKYSALIAKGYPADNLYPHPDDVVLHEDGHVTFNGPVSKGHEAAINNVMAIREALLIKATLDERQLGPDNPNDRLQNRSALTIVIMLFDFGLPPRFRWTDGELLNDMGYYDALSKRGLLKELHEVVKDAPDAKVLLRTSPMSIRALLTEAGYETIEEYGDHLRTKALQELNMA